MSDTHEQGGIAQDDFWTKRFPLFAAQFPAYYTKPQLVWGRFHTSEEKYSASSHEIIPIKARKGNRTYVLMQPYVLEQKLTITASLYDKPKHYADQESTIGETISQPKQQGFQEAQVGNAQAWYYPEDKTIVLWECFFDSQFRKHPLKDDKNMQSLWYAFERWLKYLFPKAETLATPFNDPIAESIEEYQSFLKTLGYSPIAQTAFGKKIQTIFSCDFFCDISYL